MNSKVLQILIVILGVTLAQGTEYVEEENVLVLNSKNFNQAISEFPSLLIQFYAPWCQHCKNLAPKYAEAASQLAPLGLRLAKVNADEEKVLSARQKVKAYPTLVFYRHGKRVEYNGRQDTAGIVEWVKQESYDLVTRIGSESGEEEFLKNLASDYSSVRFGVVDSSLRDQFNGDQVLLTRFTDPQYYEGPLEKEALISFFEQKGFPLVFTFTKEEALLAKKQKLPLVAYAERKETGYRNEINQLAKQLEGKVRFVQINFNENESMFRFRNLIRLGIQEETLHYYNFEKNQAVKFAYRNRFEEFLDSLLDGSVWENQKNAEVNPNPELPYLTVTEENYQSLVWDSPYDFFLVQYSEKSPLTAEQSAEIDKLQELLKTHTRIRLAKMNGDLYKFPQYHEDKYPRFIYYAKTQFTGFVPYEGEIKSQKIYEFIKSSTQQKWEGPIDPTNVIVVNEKNSQLIVWASKQDVLLEFYAPWCGHCKQLQPIYDELSVKLKPNNNIIIAKVDATAHKLPGFQISGFPTIKFLKSGEVKPQIIDFNGERTVEGFLAFLQQHTSHPWVALDGNSTSSSEASTGASADQEDGTKLGYEDDVAVITTGNFQNQVLNSQRDVLLEFYAPWCGHCKKLVPTYSELARKFKDNEQILIAKVDYTQHKFNEVSIRGFPTIILFKKEGDQKKQVTYSGNRSLEDLSKFIASHTNKTQTEESKNDDL